MPEQGLDGYPIIDRDDAAVPERGSRRGEIGLKQREVEPVGGEESAQRAADLQRAQPPAAAQPATEDLDDVPQRRAELHLIGAGPGEAFVQAYEQRSALRRAA